MPKIVSLAGRITVVVAVVVGVSKFDPDWIVEDHTISPAAFGEVFGFRGSSSENNPLPQTAAESEYEGGGVFGIATFVAGGMAWVIYQLICRPHSKRESETHQETGNATD